LIGLVLYVAVTAGPRRCTTRAAVSETLIVKAGLAATSTLVTADLLVPQPKLTELNGRPSVGVPTASTP
jgi:hypothetical protein